jgi:hypothetical protein
LGLRKTRIFLQTGLDKQVTRRVTDLPVRQSNQPVRQQIAGWVERFAKPIAIVHDVMGIASAFALRTQQTRRSTHPCVLSLVDLRGVRVRRWVIMPGLHKAEESARSANVLAVRVCPLESNDPINRVPAERHPR